MQNNVSVILTSLTFSLVFPAYLRSSYVVDNSVLNVSFIWPLLIFKFIYLYVDVILSFSVCLWSLPLDFLFML